MDDDVFGARNPQLMLRVEEAEDRPHRNASEEVEERREDRLDVRGRITLEVKGDRVARTGKGQ